MGECDGEGERCGVEGNDMDGEGTREVECDELGVTDEAGDGDLCTRVGCKFSLSGRDIKVGILGKHWNVGANPKKSTSSQEPLS